MSNLVKDGWLTGISRFFCLLSAAFAVAESVLPSCIYPRRKMDTKQVDLDASSIASSGSPGLLHGLRLWAVGFGFAHANLPLLWYSTNF